MANVVLLAGGVGGGKFAHGLQARIGERLTVVVNTGDDLERHGLPIWPDHDSVLYNLANQDDRERGWGLRDETWGVSEQLERLGQETWFRLGDRDIATHLIRAELLRAGTRPTEVARRLGVAFGIAARILPMADEPIRTLVRTDAGWLEFQEYFVHRHQADEVREVRFAGAEAAAMSWEVSTAIGSADAILVGPSNPIVSIGPILAVPGIADTIAEARRRGTPVAAVSGIVGGKALRGPADRMLASLGHEPTALGVARIYAPSVDALVIDHADASLAPAIESLGLRVKVTDTIMTDDAARARLAGEVLEFAVAR
ncbi:MAG TPA: 2-phospho-L-lactate transferase [Candidatus Limnocylindrales bacterium]|nr:2-phospho-L-lactate transferase [Candidatus Limnocylindrales bacterium]